MAKGRGGWRAGAGRKAVWPKLTEPQMIRIGSKYQRLWRVEEALAEQEALAKHNERPEMMDVRDIQEEARKINWRELNEEETEEAQDDIEHDLRERLPPQSRILRDKLDAAGISGADKNPLFEFLAEERELLKEWPADAQGSRWQSIPVNRPYGAGKRITALVIEWVQNEYGITISEPQVKACMMLFRRLERE